MYGGKNYSCKFVKFVDKITGRKHGFAPTKICGHLRESAANNREYGEIASP